MRKQLESLISEKNKANFFLKAFTISKIPLLFITGVFVKSLEENSCTLRIPFIKIVKNHLGSMYFGALSMGAEACIVMLAVNKINQTGEKISFVFKSFKADFQKRAVGPTDFICDQGELIDELISETLETRERCHKLIKSVAKTNGEIVAEFELELSLKVQS